ncbi:transcriptional regulator CynR [Streptomyces sp. NPDC051218]|uniref:transcriptional regulator CynR n=1 Tax=Streptomyces sp. NPDC051218 TaxID=3365645 RepID=UPI00379C9BF4
MASVELRHLRYLLAVVEHGSFTRAADAMHVSQPTLSQQIRVLERAVGLPLLDRSGRAVRPTDAGEVYVDHARRALRELAAADRAVQDVRDLSRGRLRLGVTPTFTAYLVGPLMAALHARHPGLDLSVREATQVHIGEAVLADEMDAGIGFTGDPVPGVEAVPLFIEALAVVAGPGAGGASPLSVDELAGRELALLAGDFATRARIDAYFAGQGAAPRVAVEADSALALLEIVRGGALTTVLPEAVILDRSGLSQVSLRPPLPHRTAALLTRSGGHRSAALQAFVGLLRTLVSELGLPPAGPGEAGAPGTSQLTTELAEG